MRSIRFIVLFAACVILHSVVQAADLTPEQEKFRSNIIQFLKEEGFSPTIDEDDNSVNFKKEGTLHWIAISDSNPFYLEFHRVGLKCNDAGRKALLAAVNYGNRKVRCAKAMLGDSSISFAIEMYCHSAEEFRYVFYKCLKELNSMHKTVSDYYNEHPDGGETVSDPFTVSSVSIANTDSESHIITSYGSKIYSGRTQYLKPKIYMNTTRTGTYDIYVKFYTPTGLSTSSNANSPAGYSYKDAVTVSATGFQAHELSGWGGNDPGHWKKGEYRFEFYYKNKMIAKKEFTVY
ncbi:hypothetical protein [Phocaeicola sartorii]|uniref:hypothetical protein n=1 Tax=Phocaeicola sartorii TaxID=671267 RepID=UPI0013628FDC|nr:hypothetical protein [Phocaeicola sartorii]NBH67901.1 hypothetical protein [Phocaeicola sartorii]